MTAVEIRKKYSTLREGFEHVLAEEKVNATLIEALTVFQVEISVEIAAQLAELNENLLRIKSAINFK